jgi:cobyrinic acid a,c-diamide synthase
LDNDILFIPSSFAKRVTGPETPQTNTDTDVGADTASGVVLAGTASGVGKTVATLVICRALERAGHDVGAAKAGPDFIDPSHHGAVLGRPSRTLDPWLEGEAGTRHNYARVESNVCVVEGMMGLYDGDISTARVTATLDLPVVLVVDASAGMESVAATALGFRAYADRADADVRVVGVLASRAHAGGHEAGIRDALPGELAYVGRIPPDEALTIPERHLGLHSGTEAPVPEDALDAAAESVRVETLRSLLERPGWAGGGESDVDGKQATEVRRYGPREFPGRGVALPRDAPGREVKAYGDVVPASGLNPSPEGGCPTVAVARDGAFRFVYPATMERLGGLADVVTFAPANGEDLPACDGVYLPGGYPELHAKALTEGPALDTLADRAAEGLPVLGECGGLMTLGESLTTADGETHAMAGVLPVDVRMKERPTALDHTELRARRDTLTVGAGDRVRGHEYHYSAADAAGDARFAFDVERGTGIDGRDGLVEHRTLGTYTHVHAESGAFDRFVARLDDED